MTSFQVEGGNKLHLGKHEKDASLDELGMVASVPPVEVVAVGGVVDAVVE
jgi:hypothetical protein